MRHLVDGIVASGLPAAHGSHAVAPGDRAAASAAVLTADPVDLMLCIEQCWDRFSHSAGPARRQAWTHGRFHAIAALPANGSGPGWNHLAGSYALENTRALQILRCVVHRYLGGGTLGVPSDATRRWLDASEVFLCGSDGRAASWLAAGTQRIDPEAVRRNAYWRLLGMDLAFGAEDGRPADFDRSDDRNTEFVPALEALLTAAWRASASARNAGAGDAVDPIGIADVARHLRSTLASRRRTQLLDRTELAASAVLGWTELSLDSESTLVADLRVHAATKAERLRLMGERVGLPAHAKASALLALGADLSALLRMIEAEDMTGDNVARLYAPGADSELVQRVVAAWSAATGRDLTASA